MKLPHPLFDTLSNLNEPIERVIGYIESVAIKAAHQEFKYRMARHQSAKNKKLKPKVPSDL